MGVSSSPPLYSKELFTRPSLWGTGTPLCAAHSCMANPLSAKVLIHVLQRIVQAYRRHWMKAQALLW